MSWAPAPRNVAVKVDMQESKYWWTHRVFAYGYKNPIIDNQMENTVGNLDGNLLDMEVI